MCKFGTIADNGKDTFEYISRFAADERESMDDVEKDTDLPTTGDSTAVMGLAAMGSLPVIRRRRAL